MHRTSTATATASAVSSRGTGWTSLRAQPWWVQALVWVFALPVAAIVWALSRGSRRGASVTAAAVLAMVCVVVPFGIAAGVDDAAIDVETGRDSGSIATAPTSSSLPASTAPTAVVPSTAVPTTAVSTTAVPTTAVPVGGDPRAIAETLLSRVAVADGVEHPGYDRDLFDHWIDADGNGCNTRCEVLLRQQLPDGRWFSVYDRTHVANSSDLDVDHVVALAEAWRSGAWSWDTDRRRDFANDLDEPRSLVAVSGSSNRSKSDRDPASWRPIDENDWCQYAISWMTVKTRGGP